MTKNKTRVELAKDINFEGTAYRTLKVNYYDMDEYLEDYKEGTIADLGICWADKDGENFEPETESKGFYVFIECNNAKGHKIDYENTPIEVLEEIGAEGYEEESEVIIDAKFKITAISYCELTNAIWMDAEQL